MGASALGVIAYPPTRPTPDYLVESSVVGVFYGLACPIYLTLFVYSFVDLYISSIPNNLEMSIPLI